MAFKVREATRAQLAAATPDTHTIVFLTDGERGLAIGTGEIGGKVIGDITESQRAALASNQALGADNAVADIEWVATKVETYANTQVATLAPVDGVLTLDFNGRFKLIAVVSLTADITNIVVTGTPANLTGRLEFELLITQSDPDTEAFDVDYTAWAGLTSEFGGVIWETEYHVYQDLTLTFITGRSYDGNTTWRLSGNPPAVYGYVEVGANVSLLRTSHEGRALRVNGAYSITVNANTDFNDGGDTKVVAAGGDVPIVASGVTVNTPGYALVVPRYATGVIFANADGSYTLVVSHPVPLDPVEVATSRALTSADFDRELFCTAAVTLTVNGSLDLPAKKLIHIKATNGNVTFAESGATINSPGDKLVLTNKGQAVLSYGRAADTVDLIGTLQ